MRYILNKTHHRESFYEYLCCMCLINKWIVISDFLHLYVSWNMSRYCTFEIWALLTSKSIHLSSCFAVHCFLTHPWRLLLLHHSNCWNKRFPSFWSILKITEKMYWGLKSFKHAQISRQVSHVISKMHWGEIWRNGRKER